MRATTYRWCPPWTGNAGLSWDIMEKWLSFDAALRYVGERRMDNDQANVQPLIDSFTTVDVRLGGESRSVFLVGGRIERLRRRVFRLRCGERVHDRQLQCLSPTRPHLQRSRRGLKLVRWTKAVSDPEGLTPTQGTCCQIRRFGGSALTVSMAL